MPAGSALPDHSYGDSERQTTRRHADCIVEELPSGEFVRRDLPDKDWVRDAFRELYEAGSIDVPRTERRGGSPVQVYKVPRRTVALAEHAIETRDPILPCGHRGLENRSDGLRCQYAGCDEVFEREEVDA